MDQEVLDIEKVKEAFVKEFALEGVPGDKVEELADKMAETLLKHLFVETMDKLGEVGAREYEALLEHQASQSEIDAFLENRIPGYNVFIRDTAARFRADLKESLAHE
ncbi:MAG: DUF5663 domain-containing protein [Candidatus Moraniibacteriota bacterium]